MRKIGLADSRFYQASSSEMFGKAQAVPQNEATPFYPRSPYGVAKTFAHYTCINYREAYGLHISSGILFNHEGEYRGHEFVTRKITSSVAKIKLGKIKNFTLGDLNPKRDWGYAGDYVEAMWKMTQQSQGGDYVIATGVTHTVKEFLLLALESAGLDKEIEKYVKFDQSIIRPTEVDLLIGDSTKAQTELHWKSRVSFEELVDLMVQNDLRIESSN
jgi:GDPmannose 4,6-dehydratase